MLRKLVHTAALGAGLIHLHSIGAMAHTVHGTNPDGSLAHAGEHALLVTLLIGAAAAATVVVGKLIVPMIGKQE